MAQLWKLEVVQMASSIELQDPLSTSSLLVRIVQFHQLIHYLKKHRQHQRMLDSGITVSRGTLTNWIQKGIELLRPIERAQWQHILQSKILAMDEVPIKAGRKKGAGRKPGQMKQTYFWPMYGDQDEVAFTWNQSRGMPMQKRS